jgi:hypothetical protein
MVSCLSKSGGSSDPISLRINDRFGRWMFAYCRRFFG